MADSQKPRFSKERWGSLFQYSQMKRQKSLYSIISLIIISGCAASPIPRSARLYDMDKGVAIEAFIEDARQVHGQITAQNQTTGENFQGEYNSIRDDVTRRIVNPSMGMGWRVITGAGAINFSFNPDRD